MPTMSNTVPANLLMHAAELPREFIGIFDSGAGGIGVLAQARRLLPVEDFVYYGDSANTPYGEKPNGWVVERSRALAGALIDRGAKAVVIACNTATAAAAEMLRAEYPAIPIIGIEPALKPAAQIPGFRRILVMATPMTLQLDKYHRLSEQWGGDCEIYDVECPGLAARIEQGRLDGADLRQLVEGFIAPYAGRVDAVVLGCTHYPFIAPLIRSIVGDVPLFDGASGTAANLQATLGRRGALRAPEGRPGRVVFLSSDGEEATLERYRGFLAAALPA